MKPNSPGSWALEPALKPVSEQSTFITGAAALTASGAGWPSPLVPKVALVLSRHLFWDYLKGLGGTFLCTCVGVLSAQRALQGHGPEVHRKLLEES